MNTQTVVTRQLLEYYIVMAFSNPEVYLSELARPLYNRFAAEPASYELAISCCVVLYHFADVLGHVRGIKAHQAASMITERIPAFETINALAQAGKHVELTRLRSNDALVGLRAEDLVRGKGAAFSDGSFYSDGSTHSDAPETVVVTTPDGRKHDVLHTCSVVIESLENQREFLQV